MVTCELCQKAVGTILMHHAGLHQRLMCFGCADRVMRNLAPQNVANGSTVERTADGYFRWRELVGKPCTRDEALGVAKGKTE